MTAEEVALRETVVFSCGQRPSPNIHVAITPK
jgi:hypothetical protein